MCANKLIKDKEGSEQKTYLKNLQEVMGEICRLIRYTGKEEDENDEVALPFFDGT